MKSATHNMRKPKRSPRYAISQLARMPQSRASGYSYRDLSLALTEMLGQPVRVTFTRRPRWMSGYEALVLLLRDRAAEGDIVAGETLAELLQRVGLVRYEATTEAPSAPATSPEKELDAAFAERTRQQNLHPLGKLAPAADDDGANLYRQRGL